MNGLLKINYGTEQPTVSARDLHEALEIKTAFKDWFPRMTEYGFEAGKDFSSEMSKSTGGRPAVDYQISIDMAKQICMIQRNEKGRRCGSRMLTRENTDSALQRSKTTNRAAALPEPLPEADGRQQDIDKCQGCRQINILTFLTP